MIQPKTTDGRGSFTVSLTQAAACTSKIVMPGITHACKGGVSAPADSQSKTGCTEP